MEEIKQLQTCVYHDSNGLTRNYKSLKVFSSHFQMDCEIGEDETLRIECNGQTYQGLTGRRAFKAHTALEEFVEMIYWIKMAEGFKILLEPGMKVERVT